ncbi:MAG TPA: hypothetical protein VN747_00680 [Burkholderiales bacterium]|jgi:hypothetical protein|nr:hypothetical protein [Burkholderiales bacterium]
MGEEEEPKGSPWGLLIFAIPFLVLGGLILAQAAGLGQFVGRSLVPNWVLGLAGAVFFCGGVLFVLRAFGVEGGGGLVGYVILFALAAVFHYATFAGDLSRWTGDSFFGLLTPGQFARLFVVTIDLFVLVFGIDWLIGKYKGVDSPLVERLEAIKAGSEQKAFALLILATPLALAIALQATGALDKIGARFGQKQPAAARGGLPAVFTQHGALQIYAAQGRPGRALAEFGGWWDSTGNWYTPGWVGRVIVRTDGEAPRLNLWRYCPPNHCDEGSFPAIVESTRDGQVLALHAKGNKDGMDWVVSLRSDPNPKILQIDERHIRSSDWNTHQQQVRGMTKVK